MQNQVSIKEHLIKTLVVSFLSCLMMLFVTELVVPIQSYFLPELTLFAALIFPVHGIRVISAWLFGWYSVIYLFVSNIFVFFLLSRHEDSLYGLLFTSNIMPENSLRLIFAFLIGDTTGTVVCLFMLIYIFKFFNRYLEAVIK